MSCGKPGIKPKDFVHCLRSQHEAVGRIEKNDTGDLDTMLLDLRAATPKAASVCVLEAAAATREFNYPAAQRALTSAMRLKPDDAGLLELVAPRHQDAIRNQASGAAAVHPAG